MKAPGRHTSRATRHGARPYRGPDRRAVRVHGLSPAPRLLSAVLVAAALVSVAAGLVAPAGMFRGDLASGLTRLETATATLAILAGTTAAIRFRVDGFAPAWWAGLALLMLGLPAVVAGPEMRFAGIHAAAPIVAAACLVLAMRSPEVNARISIVRSASAAAGALLAGWALSGVVDPTRAQAEVAQLVVATMFGLVAVAARRRQRVAPRSTWPALGVLTSGVAVAYAVAAAVPSAHPMHSGSLALILGSTMAMVAVCVVSDLHAASALQRRLAFESKTRCEAAEQEQRRTEKRFAETLHEVRSTVLALEGGVRRLDGRAFHSSAAEPAASGSSLAAALVEEIARLRDLVSDAPDEMVKTRYSIRRALEPMLTVSAAGGWPVGWSLPGEIEVAGRPADLAQVVHCLLVNATRHASGTPIDVTAHLDNGVAVILVEDRGPGVPHAMRERIFHRGARAVPDQTEAGRGLGLFIARSLVRDEGGDLWVESRPGGGARFIVAIPVADPTATLIDEPKYASRISPRAEPEDRPKTRERRMVSKR